MSRERIQRNVLQARSIGGKSRGRPGTTWMEKVAKHWNRDGRQKRRRRSNSRLTGGDGCHFLRSWYHWHSGRKGWRDIEFDLKVKIKLAFLCLCRKQALLINLSSLPSKRVLVDSTSHRNIYFNIITDEGINY